MQIEQRSPELIFGKEDNFAMGAFHSIKNTENFENGDKWYRTFQEKLTENLEIVEFPKSEHFHRKFRENSQYEFPKISGYITWSSSFP